jgi:hypothetical protein
MGCGVAMAAAETPGPWGSIGTLATDWATGGRAGLSTVCTFERVLSERVGILCGEAD